MNIDKMIQLINLELKKDKNISANKIIDKLGLKKSQLRKANYVYNAELRQYTKDITSNITSSNVIENRISNRISNRLDNKITQEVDTPGAISKEIDTDKLNLLLDNLDSILKLIPKGNITSNTSLRTGKNDVKSFRVDTGLYKAIKERATRDNINIADIINKALEDYLNNYI